LLDIEAAGKPVSSGMEDGLRVAKTSCHVTKLPATQPDHPSGEMSTGDGYGFHQQRKTASFA